MRIHGLLCWYDEPPESLIACIAALHVAGVDSIVASDGAYALYPNAAPRSNPDQHAAIQFACREVGIGCTLHVPSEPWQGNEPEKRTQLFALANTLADGGDWFWVQDADQVVTECPDDLKERLAASPYPVAEVTILDLVAQRANVKHLPPTFAMRSLFRAQPIAVGPAHCDYIGADGNALWHGHGIGNVCDALDLSDVVIVEHRPDQRPRERQLAKYQYYATRDESGFERGDCAVCGARAVKLVPVNWRMSEIGPVAEWREACAEHVDVAERISRVELEALGINPSSVHVAARNGRIPDRVAA